MFERVPRLVFISVRNGLLAGLLGIVFLVILYFVGRHPFLFPVYFDFRLVLISAFVVITLKELRDDHQQGVLYFGQGMIAAFLFTLVFALIAAGFILIFSALYPAFVQDYITLATSQLRSIDPAIVAQLGKEVVERNINELPATNGADLALDYLVKSVLISFFISLIISVILRRQPKN
ncbi:MAG: DUF4199 domain-containing protein [Cytophagales bacterium]|nr:DUF4199 domain-containing protein [Cytophagales bacterium]